MYPPAQLTTPPPPNGGQKYRPQRKPTGKLIDLPDPEVARMLGKISGDYGDAWQDNERRIERFKRHFRSTRSKVGMVGGLQGRSNFRVPLIIEKILIKWAKTLDSLLGDDAEIVAQPTGPVDRAVAEKVGRYMTWQVFNHMDVTEELAKFIFQEIVFGRAHAELYYDVRYLYDADGNRGDVLYDGPIFRTIPFDCYVAPPSAGESTPQDFAWVCTREWKTLDQLLADEEEGYVTGISENAEKIYRHAETTRASTPGTDELKKLMADFEGVVSDYAVTDRCRVEVRKHYHRWRMLKGRTDASYDDFKARRPRESELVTMYIPDLSVGDGRAGLHIGTRNLAEMYPNTANRRPIVSASLFKDGSYWCQGLPELLEDVEIEMSVNHNLMNEAGERAVSPPGFYIPGMGIGEEKQKIEPGMLYPTPDPKSVYFADTRADYNFCVVRNQMLTAIGEGVSGLPASSVGRSPDTPNQPRTFRGQALLQGQSDVRNSLEQLFMSEDWSKILDQIKMLVDEYGPDEEEFRVTESAPSGYFNHSFSKITARERQGKYDFKLKFATSAQSREARKERALALLPAAAALPVFLQNANLQRDWLKVIAKELQLDGLLPSLSAVPNANVPTDPEIEWVQALQGIAPQISILDDDEKHIQSHMQHLTEQQQLPNEDQDEDAQQKMIAHVMQHKEQQRQKLAMMAQAQAQAAAQQMAQGVAGLLGGPEAAQGQQGQQQQPMQQFAGPLGQLAAGGMMAAPSMGAVDQAAGFPGDISPTDLTGGY